MVALSLVAQQASAQTDEERAGARAAATEGMTALREHRWSDAVDLFSRAQHLINAPTHLLYLSQAQEQLGLLVQAHENLEKAARTPLTPTAPLAFREAQQTAEAELGALEARLPYVTVNVVGGGAVQVTVTEDGRRISDELVGVPRPVDPGTHTFVATATGLSGTATVEVKEKDHDTVVIKLAPFVASTPAPQPATAAPVVRAPVATTPAPPPATATAPEDEGGQGSNGMRIGSYVAFGVGAVGLGLGTVFLLNSASKTSKANDEFDANHCGQPQGCPASQAEIQSLDSSANSAKTLGIVSLAVGGVGVATGVVLFVMSGKKSERTASSGATVHPWVGLGSAGVDGTF